MNTFRDVDNQLERWLAEELLPEMLLTPLPDDIAKEVVDKLEKEFVRYWYSDLNRSMRCSERIIAIGSARTDPAQIAFGTMRKADCLGALGNMDEAWKLYDQAGTMFDINGDEVGWARTRVGRLYLGSKLNRISITLAEAERARAIFTRYGEQERLLRLDWQTALMYNYLGEQHRALELFVGALAMADVLGEEGKPHIGPLSAMIGVTYQALGDFNKALTYYNHALTLAISHNETLNIASLEASIAEIAQAQGQYLRALNLLQGALEKVKIESPFKAAGMTLHMVECYLALNRYTEARELAQQLLTDFRMFNASDEIAFTLSLLAMSEAVLGNLESAQTALEEAESIFTSLNAVSWVATIRLWRGRIALRRGNFENAYQESVLAATAFEADGQQVNDATATLLRGQAQFALNKFDSAATAGHKALNIAQCYNVPSLRYAAHLLLGQIAEARSANRRAMRSYKAASATIERVQRGLTITLRPGFLEDKGEAMRALIALHLKLGDTQSAFETLERAKSQVWLGYMMNRESLRWAINNSRSEALIEELNSLRAEHHWFYRLAHDPPKDTEHPIAIDINQALAEIALREKRMRAITERLYMNNGGDQRSQHASVMSLEELQKTLDERTLLVEYYDDGKHLWAFTLDQQTVNAHRLPLTTEMLKQLISQLQSNLAAGLKIESRTPAALNHTHLSHRILRRMYQLLVEPLALQQHNIRRLIIVPYGELHFLPFNLLYDGSAYLIESYEIVVLPVAGLAARRGPKRAPGTLILSHTWDGRLPNAKVEGQIVQRLFGGRLYTDELANRSVLQSPPTQILHIAAHGHHRLDQPDLSYLQLADGQLYTDDVLQQDLSYELVTLSACETGRAKVAADEELIGIGRGFLYAGAGALLLSLWSVADDSTVTIMERMYSDLRAGASKAAALRNAQIMFLAEHREEHPALWGAFQLIGDPSPLSI